MDEKERAINKIARELGRILGIKSLPKVFLGLKEYDGPTKIPKQYHIVELLTKCKNKRELFTVLQRIIDLHKLSPTLLEEIIPALRILGFQYKNGALIPINDKRSTEKNNLVGQTLTKKYYSIRNKKRSGMYNLDVLKKLFINLYLNLEDKGYFQEQFGYWCVDASTHNNWTEGNLGRDIEAIFFNALLKENLWPIPEKINLYSEDDLFDVIEFLFDHVSRPTKGSYHSYSDCGMHYSKFNKTAGQDKFREMVNEILTNYGDGFEISKEGRVLIKDEKGLTDIFRAKVTSSDKDIKTKIDLAIQKYRSSRSDFEERRIAVRELADVLEKLRPMMKRVMLKKDENAIFNIANNFYIRHSNEKQMKHYDKNIWYSWMFYFYLSTIHTLLRLIEKYEKS